MVYDEEDGDVNDKCEWLLEKCWPGFL